MTVDPSKADSLVHNIDAVLNDDGGGDPALAHQYRHLLKHAREHLVRRNARETAVEAAARLFQGSAAPEALGFAEEIEAYLLGEDAT